MLWVIHDCDTCRFVLWNIQKIWSFFSTTAPSSGQIFFLCDLTSVADPECSCRTWFQPTQVLLTCKARNGPMPLLTSRNRIVTFSIVLSLLFLLVSIMARLGPPSLKVQGWSSLEEWRNELLLAVQKKPKETKDLNEWKGKTLTCVYLCFLLQSSLY